MSAHAGTAFGADLARRLGEAAAAPPDLLARVGSGSGRTPFSGVFAPDSPDGIAEALAACSAEEWPVIPLGAATWWHPSRAGVTAMAAGDRPPVLLSTVRLDRITEHVPADLVVGVQAGLPLRQLAAALADKQQWLPLDPASAPHATIGATVALADAGPLRAAHGTPRDMALGVEIATGDGRLLRFGGRVVKNVAGYDGVRLAVGSRGTLGIITAVYLRVRGAPRADRTLALPCGGGRNGARRGAELALAIRSAAACDAVELLSPAAARRVTGGAAEWTLLVRLLGGQAAVAEGVDRVSAAASARPGERPTHLPVEIWATFARLEADAGAAVRLSGPVTGLADGLGLAESLAGSIRAESNGDEGWLTAAHAADGIVRLWHCAPPTAAGDLQNFLRPPGDLAETRGWTMRYDRFDSTWGSPLTDAAPDAAAPAQTHSVAELTARLRAVFDPAGILSGAEA